MIPMYLYAPTEQISFNLFSKLARSDSRQERIEKSQEVLSLVFRFVNVIGLLCVLIGIPLSGSYIQFLYGEKWSVPNCVLALKLYCVYEYTMGYNGVIDAFVNGSITTKDMGRN